MFVFIIAMLLVCALALWLRPATNDLVSIDADPYDSGGKVLTASLFSIKSKLFLYAYVWTFLKKFQRLVDRVLIQSQVTLLTIKQALLEMWLGRGMQHS